MDGEERENKGRKGGMGMGFGGFFFGEMIFYMKQIPQGNLKHIRNPPGLGFLSSHGAPRGSKKDPPPGIQ